MERGKVCALTGHRELPESVNKNALLDGLEELIKNGYDYFLCGMAKGFDLLALECLVYLRKKYLIQIEACIPYRGHEHSFTEKEKRKYSELVSWCSVKTVLFESYRKGCFLVRDCYMVDCADLLFAYCIKKTGGAFYTVNYAEKKGIPVQKIIL